ncbi:MAG: diacylglycerol kinase family lipid kinase [Solirubrobacteraceae bacterium]|nr:diacylglycerol kinase family lipid kinase [Solirubrobacteraceae bacterium]
MSRPIRLIVNPSSGGGRTLQALPEVQRALDDLGLEHEVRTTRDLEHGRELARGALEAGQIAVTFSGDGLIGAVAGVLAGHPDACLGILPGGRGNDLARVLGIPRDDLAAACRVLRDGSRRPLDVGMVADRPFVGIASFGFDSDANRIANLAPAWLGQGVYAYAALRALGGWRPARFVIEADDRPPREVTAYSVGLANASTYGGGMRAAPHAELDDGRLDLVIVHDMPKRRFLTHVLPRVFSGTHVDLPEVEEQKVHTALVRADRPFTVYADGDPIGELPCDFSVRRHALQVLAPAERAA